MSLLKYRSEFILITVLSFVCAFGLMILRCSGNHYACHNMQLEQELLSLQVLNQRANLYIAHLHHQQNDLPAPSVDRVLYLQPQKRHWNAYTLAYNR